MTLGSALLLGFYDVFKKKALKNNSVLWVLLGATALSALMLSPCLTLGTPNQHLRLVLKAILVTTSWVSGMIGLKLLPITTVSMLKSSRPFLVVLFSIILFGEQLNAWQWGGIALALLAITLLSVSSSREGISFAHSKGVAAMVVSILSGVASALYDNYIVKGMDALFVQSWSNVYITVILAACILVKALRDGQEREKFHWDWMILVIAVFITGADMLYFFSLKQEGALLSVISLMRRSSVIVTFIYGAITFKENRVKQKAIDLVLLLIGMVFLLIGSE